MKLEKKNIWYKYDNMAHIEYDDGIQWSIVAHPRDYPDWDSLPDGELPGQSPEEELANWRKVLTKAEVKFFDFGTLNDDSEDIPK